ncbi:protein HIRA-like isoform X1 [Schistocerca piceifrons]|uniref:protein HIRA-like isoform X1 n=2 Tax=Schistocerca piceifrons TaxID=274613 RepID=UPI001F5FC8DB|nr:protein HIRA-like isoform X1 [Schistocerca piceifrons]
MKLLKPTWVSHDELPIFSVDIHPDGSRFATGGQGGDSGRIVIWNMAPVVSPEIENDENIPKMLCQMDNHLACVNCVRWSFSGKFLASGGDDKLIMIWKISKYTGATNVFGSVGKVNVESWRCCMTLRGHNGDVLDMAWSPHDAWLASCSVDNTVIVWNALKMPEMVAVLKGHSGLVKGVAWDPVGKYMASQSDDKTLRVWRTADWKEDSVITEPFEECGGTTHVLRLSWSPDGQYLVSAHAMNGGGPTAQIVEREGWRKDKDFVGHRKAVTCVRFNSNILQKQYRSSSKPQQYCCCAIGSRDRSLSVWLTALKRPLVVLHELFTNSVLDLSWSCTGLQLMACSWDGTVAFVEFSEDELGKPLTMEEKTMLHERMYGKSLSAAGGAGACVVETPELLAVREKAEKAAAEKAAADAGQTNGSLERPAASVSQPSTPLKGPINKQIETRTSDGKRRITPMYIPPAPDAGDGPRPFGLAITGSAHQPTFSSSSETKSRIMIEKRDDVVRPNVSSSGGTPGSSKSCDGTPSPAGSTPVKGVQADNSLAGTQVVIGVTDNKHRSTSNAETKLELQKVERSAPVAAKRRLDREPLGGKGKRMRLLPPADSKPAPQPVPPPAPAASEHPALSLPVLRLSKSASVPLLGGRKRLEVSNGALNTPHGPLTRVCVCSVADTEQPPDWEAVLGSPAAGVAANNQVIAIACQDAMLHLLDLKTGRRPFPPLVLSAAPSRLVLSGLQHVMVITSNGCISVWDFEKSRCLIKNESLMPIMRSEPGSVVTILSCTVTEKGCPIISLSTGKAFMFSSDLSCWLLMGDSLDAVQRSCAQRTFTQLLPQENKLLPLASLQSHIKGISSTASRLLNGANVGPLCTITFLEQQLSACVALNSPKEYHSWLMCLARFLIQEGLESKLRLICNDLLGPTHSHSNQSKSWENAIMGFSKHVLLREILSLMGTNLRLQRLLVEYSDQLTQLEQSAQLFNGMEKQ